MASFTGGFVVPQLPGSSSSVAPPAASMICASGGGGGGGGGAGGDGRPMSLAEKIRRQLDPDLARDKMEASALQWDTMTEHERARGERMAAASLEEQISKVLDSGAAQQR